MAEVRSLPRTPRPAWCRRPTRFRNLESTLAELSGDAAFAKEFFARYVQGRELVDYPKLFLRAGLIVRKEAPGKPWIGDVRLQVGAGGGKVASQVLFDSPLYKAGAEQDDVIVSVDGVDLAQASALDTILARHKPGDTMSHPLRSPIGRASRRHDHARRGSAGGGRAARVGGRDIDAASRSASARRG